MSQIPPQMPPQMPGQPGMPYGAPPPQQQTNGLAIAGLIMGIAGMCFVPLSLGAVICGALGLSKTKDPRVGGKGIALAGLILGCVGILFGIVAVSILLPSLNRAREMANRIKCQSNMSQIGKGIMLYANENRGAFPPDLPKLVADEGVDPSALVCPSSDDTAGGTTTSYVYVKGLTYAAGGNTIVVYEVPDHHHDGINVLCIDGSAHFLEKADADAALPLLTAGKRATVGGRIGR